MCNHAPAALIYCHASLNVSSYVCTCNTNYYSFWLFHVGFSDRFEVSAWHQLRRKKVSNSCLLIEVQWAITSGNVIQAELVLKTFCFSGYCCILGWISLFKLGLQNLMLKNGFCKQFYKPNMKTRYGNRVRESSLRMAPQRGAKNIFANGSTNRIFKQDP